MSRRSPLLADPAEPLAVGQPIASAFFLGHPVDVARGLIGAVLEFEGCAGRIVETEAYSALDDAASHVAMFKAAREFLSTSEPGTAYVFRHMGLHWLLNLAVRGNPGGFVLLRALEPLRGLARMAQRRDTERVELLCSGPGRIGQAFGFNGSHHGKIQVGRGALKIFETTSATAPILATRRIGIVRAAELPWRFVESGALTSTGRHFA